MIQWNALKAEEDALKAEVVGWQNQYNALRSQFRVSQTEHGALEAQYYQLMTRFHVLQTENEALEVQMKALKDEEDALKPELVAFSQELGRYKTILAKTTTLNSDLKDIIFKRNTISDELKAITTKRNTLFHQLEAKTAKIDSLNASMAESLSSQMHAQISKSNDLQARKKSFLELGSLPQELSQFENSVLNTDFRINVLKPELIQMLDEEDRMFSEIRALTEKDDVFCSQSRTMNARVQALYRQIVASTIQIVDLTRLFKPTSLVEKKCTL